MPYSKIPPNDPQAEQALLGAMLIDRQVIPKIAEIVKSGDFYRESHREIYETVIELYNQGEPIDLITLTDKLKGRNTLEIVGGIIYLTELMQAVPAITNVNAYCEIIKEKSQRRQLIKQGNRMLEMSYGVEAIDDIISETEQAFINITSAASGGEVVKAGDLTDIVLDKFEYYHKNKGYINGVSTGFTDLDNMLLGLQKTDLIVIAARPSMGKTALALNIAETASLSKYKTIFFSLEMSKDLIMQRLVCNLGLVNHTQAKRGDLRDEDWKNAVDAAGILSRAELFIDDSSPLKVSQIKTKCRSIKGLSLVVIDYIDFLLPELRSNDNRTQIISQITKDLKSMAKQLNVPVVLLVQLSRKCEERQNKRPMLSDLRDSGAIEQDADVVMFVYRDDYYYPDSDKKGIAEVIVAKQRNGETGTVELGWMPEYTRFVNIFR